MANKRQQKKQAKLAQQAAIRQADRAASAALAQVKARQRHEAFMQRVTYNTPPPAPKPTLKEAAKKKGGYWKGGKTARHTYEGQQYTGGRQKGTPNLKKTAEGNLLNQHGVTFTQAERKELERLANKANKQRMKQLEEEGKLPRMKGGKETGDTVKSLQLMGKESDFIISRKHKSLQKFKSREAFEKYLDNLRIVTSPDYIDKRTDLYKDNHIKALENVFGHDADDVIAKIREMDNKEYRKKLQSDEDLEVSYVYDPSAAAGKLNKIRRALGMEMQEAPV